MQIQPERGHQVVTKNISKKFRVVYDKRILGPNFYTYPYGYSFEN